MTNRGSTQEAITPKQQQGPAKQTVGLIIKDPAYRRLFEGLVINLDLEPTMLKPSDIGDDRLFGLEMIVADQEEARKLRPLVKEEQATGEVIKPALVALVNAPYSASSQKKDSEDFDAVLSFPGKPCVAVGATGGGALRSLGIRSALPIGSRGAEFGSERLRIHHERHQCCQCAGA